MPHALTERQRQVLDFLKQFIGENESAPTLSEIAEHFGVTLPTAHNYLKALQQKGFLYFDRDSNSGFYIRLIETAGKPETVVEVAVAGKIDRWGELFDFPENHGHFVTLLSGAEQEYLFALLATEDIPEVGILNRDLIIFDRSKTPQPGDICVAPIGERLFLIRVDSRTFDAEMQSLVIAQKYPLVEELAPERRQFYNWYPLALEEETEDYFIEVAREEQWPVVALPPELIVATALRLTRTLAF